MRSDAEARGAGRRLAGAWLSVVCLAVGCAAAAAASESKAPIAAGYAVVISRSTHDDAAWRKVAETLVRKHNATMLVYDGPVRGSLGRLRRQFPRYACFVARPEEAGRDFVVSVHRMTRRLDDDPYTDVLWGILTGFSAADAQRIASAPGPLIIRKAGAGTGLDLSLFDEGKWFSESKAGEYWQKTPGGKPEKKQGPVDSTKAIVEFLNEGRPDLFLTSGHATQRDWQIGYTYRNGQLRCRDGKLFGLDLKRKVHPIDSPNPKVFLGAGNCLIGDIRDRQSMALAWLGSGGANQFVGYTVSTWYGAMGWGTRDYLLDLPGRYTLAEAFFFANQSIVYRLHERFAKKADVEFDRFNMERDRRLLGRHAARLGYRRLDKTAREHLGLLWDRDTVAFYGDPAWDARLAKRDLPLTSELTEQGGTYTFTVRVKQACKPQKPLAMLLPHRIADVHLTAGKEFQPLITDMFVMLMKSGPFGAAGTHRVVFQAERVGD